MKKEQQRYARTPQGLAQQAARDADWATLKLAETLCCCTLRAERELRLQEMARRLT